MANTIIIDEAHVRGESDVSDRKVMDWIFATADSIPLFLARIGLGIVFIPHGLQKVSTLFGGYGFSGTMHFFTGQGIPAIFAFLAIMAEFLGSIGLLVGFLSRIAAFGVMCNMIVAVMLVHAPNGFFMNWAGDQKGEGFEFHLLAITLALVVIAGGAGRWSVDRAIYRRTGSER